MWMKTYALYEVDLRSDWATPWGSAAHRTPSVGTEINHTLL
ncbi:hypothetical protein ACPCXF_05370 [Lysinibacillus agricola]